ncbi:hypothetical protein PWYN_20665 [Paenibacillus wynnii]|uniref:Uncharacterized protein n=1 Tax=Paenibacillus wynnii TaxID=268407 RepID=A0A098M4W5_9BACL|nr:hypothetical protein PWYN_20665 [Paenibacillus wynnii]
MIVTGTCLSEKRVVVKFEIRESISPPKYRASRWSNHLGLFCISISIYVSGCYTKRKKFTENSLCCFCKKKSSVSVWRGAALKSETYHKWNVFTPILSNLRIQVTDDQILNVISEKASASPNIAFALQELTLPWSACGISGKWKQADTPALAKWRSHPA